jgi:ATP/maltotriose-dependent transcriptional regulator MalT/DNA-binding SARP family transcriptional activator
MKLIQNKISVPPGARRRARRARLDGLIRKLLDERRVVWVTGSAGAGKTTAVADAIEGDHAVAWLTVERSEAAPGRLLAYLEAALMSAAPEMPSVARDALLEDAPHEEAAGLLAEALSEQQLTLVLDELENIADAPAALNVLAAFFRYAPASLHAVLISRRRIPLRSKEMHEWGVVGEQDLAFTREEAVEAMALLGYMADDAESAVEATGGWVAGVLFDAWRSPHHVHGAGGEADALRGYLAGEIMTSLPQELQEFLIVSSVLPVVTPTLAEGLGLLDAALALRRLRGHHLPVSFEGESLNMRCHTRFRAFLREELDNRGSDTVAKLRRRWADLLVAEHRYEDAVEEYLATGASVAAFSAAEVALPDVLRRADVDIAERWLGAFPADRVGDSEVLTYGALVIAVDREQWNSAARYADQLMTLARRSGRMVGPDEACAVAWSYYLASRIDDALAVLAEAPDSPQTAAMRFATEADLFSSPTHYRNRPQNPGAAVDAFLARIDFSHGRFLRLADPPSPWAASRASSIAALRALGRLDEAAERLREVSSRNWSMVQIQAELMADLGRIDEARAALLSGQDLLTQSGASSFQLLSMLMGAMLDLRFDRDTESAARALRLVEAEPTARRRIRISEQLDLYWGWIALLDGNNETGAARLRQAVDTMVTWDRVLLLPTAAVFLAEAEWRLANEDAADAAADLALDAARRQGSTHLLNQALREFPSVVARRLDAEPAADSEWHDIGRALMAAGRLGTLGLSPRVVVREFGVAGVVIDGVDVEVKLIKSVETLAYLAAHDGYADREELLGALFEGRNVDSTRAYLRQALNALRQILPEDAPLEVTPEHVALREGLTSDSLVANSAFTQAAILRGEERLAEVRRGLAIIERGPYLVNARSPWATERADHLRDLANDARQMAAEAKFELGDYRAADQYVQRILSENPFMETTWRLAMRLASAMGHGDRVIALFRSCQEALALLEIKPSESTRRLLDALRP